MKRIVLVLVIVLIATPAFAARYCDIGIDPVEGAIACPNYPADCPRSKSVGDREMLDINGTNYWGPESNWNAQGFYRATVISPPLSRGEKYEGYTCAYVPTELQVTKIVVADPNYPTLGEYKKNRLKDGWNNFVVSKEDQECIYNGNTVPKETQTKMHLAIALNKTTNYLAIDSNGNYIKFTDIAPSVAQTILNACEGAYESAKDEFLTDDPNTENADCVGAQDPFVCCTGAGTGNCDIDAFLTRIANCADYDCVDLMVWSQSIPDVGTN